MESLADQKSGTSPEPTLSRVEGAETFDLNLVTLDQLTTDAPGSSF